MLFKNKIVPTAPRFSLRKNLKHLQKLRYYPDLIIDAGAAFGAKELYVVFPKSNFLWIEPLKDFNDDLEKLVRTYNGRYLNLALGSSAGKIKFRKADDLIGSRIYDGNSKIDNSVQIIEVDQVKLDDLEEIKGYSNILLRNSVQGNEIEVLKGAYDVLLRTEVIVLDLFLWGEDHYNSQFLDAIQFMDSTEFCLYDICGGHNRPLDDALSQVMAVFVKKDGFLRKDLRWANKLQMKQWNSQMTR